MDTGSAVPGSGTLWTQPLVTASLAETGEAATTLNAMPITSCVAMTIAQRERLERINLMRHHLDFHQANDSRPQKLRSAPGVSRASNFAAPACTHIPPTAAGLAARLTDNDITLARQAILTDARETALIAVALRILAEPASITDEDVT
jgi:hypothetical protein